MSHGLDHGDLVGGPLDDTMLNSERARNARDNVFASALQAPAGYLPYAPSGNLGFGKAAFESIGGFDESLTISAEDVDLSWRAQEAGLDLAFVPEAAVQCRYRSSLTGLCAQQYRYALGFAEVYARRVERGLMPAQTPAWQRRTLVLHLKRFAHLERLIHRETRWRYVRGMGWFAGGARGYLRYRVFL